MIRLSKLVTLTGLFLVLQGAYASGQPTTFLGPTLKGSFTRPVEDNTAISIAGEAGIKNFRIGATAGWLLNEDQRLKFTAEYLWQKITYSFITGNQDKWVEQAAVGAVYEHDLDGYRLRPQINFGAWYSYAPSHDLFNGQILLNGTVYNYSKRIAGSNAFGVLPGVTIHPWRGGKTRFSLNYDDVRYDQKYGPSRDELGFGGTFQLDQAISEKLSLGLTAGIRKPFNNYAAGLNWNNIYYYGLWSFGVDGEYTDGKNTLPNTWNVGLNANYFMDCFQPPATTIVHDYKGNLKGEIVTAPPTTPAFLAWTAEPAVYMPQVLAIPDEQLHLACTTGQVPRAPDPATLPNYTDTNGFYGNPPLIPPFSTQLFNAATAFGGTQLVYSINSVNTTTEYSSVPPNQLFTINPKTGIVTLTVPVPVNIEDAIFSVTVTATNPCGTAYATFPVEIDIYEEAG